MASNAAKEGTRQLKSARGAFAVAKKYSVPSTGIWARIHRLLAVDPNRSTGVPLNAHFRNPPPGANPPTAYDDPVTLPAGDLAENPYWKRDMRRSYPQLSVVRQADVVGLLSVGSAAAPKETLQIGDAGTKQLVEARKEGEGGLSVFLAKEKGAVGSLLDERGLPPMPVGMNRAVGNGAKRYVIDIDREEGFPEK
ncbi:MAG: hypothetical protein MMC33_000953 [Icmadophila ericetorum]|nr:hypothetical protein [Icmadophila ericetorum]